MIATIGAASQLRATPNEQARESSLFGVVRCETMPELPDISAYITALESRIIGEPIEYVRLANPLAGIVRRAPESVSATGEGGRPQSIRLVWSKTAGHAELKRPSV